jgi:hypothetical protein
MFDQEKVDDFMERAENTAKNFDSDTAFKIITTEIDSCEDKYLNEYVGGLNFIRNEKTLAWIELASPRIVNVSQSWGHLAASSHFSWVVADKWLSKGRPLSLIALDALIFCTTFGKRLNQSLWMRQINPTLVDKPTPEVVSKRLHEYLVLDNVPRTKFAVQRIIENIFTIHY